MIALATLFTHPMQLSNRSFWLLMPIIVGVSVAYKTIRCSSLRRLPREMVTLTLYVLAGVGVLMAAGWGFVKWCL